ncbi:lipopolysaccharide biosynthesis protein [Lacimicrobium sp. SS2-24]|uniref:lipopolysaccharide biosynthesis protein n=1 Tax=Lacimicrobium sp. SS2-24 TaxID=2005569 RepID=UPI000B4B2A88|nr:lipopolysaccharide biosynthesis protein [Lacimicrobium sp. SS2-24]
MTVPHSPKDSLQQSEQNTNTHSKVYSGSAFMLITRIGIKSIGLISSIILARLLVPEDFGLVAIAMAIYAFIELFGALGLGTVLIQSQSDDRDDYNTAWTFKVLFGTISALAMLLAAPYVAQFYSDPRLEHVIYVIAFASILSGAANIGVVNFQKDMDFRKELKYQLMPKLISFVITLTLAFIYRNYWALVIGMVSNQFIILLFSYWMHPFRPRFGLKSFNKLFSFSRWLLLNNVLFYLNDKFSELIVGRVLSPSAVGIFAIGKEIAHLPTMEMAKPINKATFPVYSRFKDNFTELRKAYLNTVALTACLTMPAALGIALIAPLFVEVVLGDKWLPAAPLIQLLALSSMLTSITVNNGYIYMACGKPNIMFLINFIRTAMFFAFFIPLLDSNGIVGIGQARLVTTLIMLFGAQAAVVLFLKLKVLPLLAVFLRPTLACIVMGGSVLLIQRADWLPGQGLSLLMQILAGGLSYTLMSMLLWRWQGYPEGLERTVIERLYPGYLRGRI